MGLWEMLTKGEGAPWGAMQTGRPDMPVADLGAYQGYNTQPAYAAGKARIGRGAAAGREQALARLRQAGVQGADQGAALANVAGQQAEAEGNLEAALAQLDQQTRMANRDFAMQRYANDLSAFGAENAGRGAFWNSLAELGGSLGGAYLGGAMGRKGVK